MDILDKAGQLITPGCIIAYGSGRGEISLGKVMKLEHKVNVAGNYTRNVYKIKVHGMYSRYYADTNTWKNKLADKTSTLSYPDRVVVLDPANINADIRLAFDEVRV